jgi:ATP-dependent Clp protease ATP-binding subunit ClpC
MFERFTERSRRVVVLAQEEARMLDHNYIGTEHILLGLIHQEDGVAARAIGSLGLTLQSARDQVREMIGQGQQTPTGHIPFTPRAKKVLELSLREALALRKDYIGTEHILLGLVRESDGVGAQILQRTAPLAAVRERVLELATAEGTEAEQEELLGREWLSPGAQAGVVRLSPRAVASVRAEVVSEFRETLAAIGGTLEALEQRLAGIERRLGITPKEPAEAAAAETAAAGETAAAAADEIAAEETGVAADETAEAPQDETPEESAE